MIFLLLYSLRKERLPTEQHVHRSTIQFCVCVLGSTVETSLQLATVTTRETLEGNYANKTCIHYGCQCSSRILLVPL